MRPAGKGELESLYFDYPQFPAPAPRENLAAPVRVAIVGAGPIGMTAALTLARYGVESVLFDNKSTFNDGSRAVCIARPSMHILQALNIEKAFLEKALPWTSGRSFYRGSQILEFFMPDSAADKYRPMYNLEQQYMETYLHEAIHASDLIDMRWQSEVTGLDDREDGIALTIRDPVNGVYDMHADWVLAADGARSPVRSLRGRRLQGQNYEGRYVIADIKMAIDRKVERIALFDPECRPGGTVLVHQQPDYIWRVDYQLREGEREDDALQESEIRRCVASVLNEIGFDADWELEWWSIYSANTLALDDYRDGRLFFIGDAAHIVPIFGVRGLNNGLADAQNIGWKLAYHLNGRADGALLDSYNPERRGATLDVFANAQKSTRFMTPHSRGWSLLRDAALSLALRHPFAGAFANPRNMTPYTYAESPLALPDADGFQCGPIPGEPAHNVKLEADFLLDRFGIGFTALIFGTADGFSSLTDRFPDLTLLAMPPDGPAARAYDADDGSVYLARPDQHIVARWKKADVETVGAVLEALLKRGCVR